MNRLSIIVAIMLLLNAFILFSPQTTVSAFPAAGSGTPGDPYQITNIDELYAIRYNLSAHYKLMNDLDFQNVSHYTGDDAVANMIDNTTGTGWLPIGGRISTNGTWVNFDVSDPCFLGLFDGQNFTVNNLFISRGTAFSTTACGFFGYTGPDAVIKNLGLINSSIDCWQYGGSLVGYCKSDISNCYATGIITSFDMYSSHVGGLIGEIRGTVTDSYSAVSNSGAEQCGGFFGYLLDGTIQRCYSTGNVTSTGYWTGGFGGHCGSSSIIIDCFSTGNVSSTYKRTGGFLGSASSGVVLNNCYSVGHVQSTNEEEIGGFIGQIVGSPIITACFYDNQTSGQTTSPGGTGRNTSDMMNFNTFNDASWDIAKINNWTNETWFIDDGRDYPRLFWEFETFEPPFPNGNGSESDPYQITHIEHLYAVRHYLDKNFTLKNNLNFQNDSHYLYLAHKAGNTTGEGWLPIGNESPYFCGTFDGNGKTISNLFINRSTDGIGLFSINAQDKGKIHNLGLINVNISGGYYVGALVGYNVNHITNSYATGSINGEGIVGGLVGYNVVIGNISNCYAHVNVTRTSGTNDRFGGLIGLLWYGYVYNSYSTGSVKWQEAPHPTDKGFSGGLLNPDYYPWGFSGNFFDNQTSGQTSDNTSAVGKNTSDMMDFNTFNDAGWDIMGEDTETETNYPQLGGTNTWWIYLRENLCPTTNYVLDGMIDSPTNGTINVSLSGIVWVQLIDLNHDIINYSIELAGFRTEGNTENSTIYDKYDVNDDCTIDIEDLNDIWAHRNETDPYNLSIYDVNNDGEINVIDLSDTWFHRGYSVCIGENKIIVLSYNRLNAYTNYTWYVNYTDGECVKNESHWFITGAGPNIVYIDDDYTSSTPSWQYDHFDVIQDGIDTVAEDGTVLVYNGTYYENLIVNKTINLIGENRNSTIVDGNGSNGMEITADFVNITGFTIQNGYYGIHLIYSNNGCIACNIIKNNNQCGIQLIGSNYNLLTDNDVINNYQPYKPGIQIHDSSNNNFISGNYVSNNEIGIAISGGSSNNSVNENNISYNTYSGIVLFTFGNSTINGNIVSYNPTGIMILSSQYNNIYNNFFDNDINFAVSTDNNFWNISRTPGTNIIGGPYLGGNYWSDYTGVDTDGDGLGNTQLPYGPGDYLPLTDVNYGPVADFTWIPTDATTQNNIQFTDTSTDIDGTITSWSWDFGDGDNSSLQNPTHQYDDYGVYNVCLMIRDNYGALDIICKNITVYNIEPVANFAWTPSNPKTIETVFFNDTSYDLDGFVKNWSWSFGDGDTRYLQHPTYQYITAGTYLVCLTITDNDGAIGSISKNITVRNNTSPMISQVYPLNNSLDVSRPVSSFNISVFDDDGDLMMILLRWINHIGLMPVWEELTCFINVTNGSYEHTPPMYTDWIWGNTTYTWSVNVTDGYTWTNETYVFTTGGSRYDVTNDDNVNYLDALTTWNYRTNNPSGYPYDGLYDVNGDGKINYIDALMVWAHRG